MYPIENRPASKNSWFTPAESNNYYAQKYAREGVTIHHWGGGEPASAHDNIVEYFMGQGQQGVKSVNYVVSDNKITQMVDPDNVAWCSGPGNPTTISIEFQPTLGDEGYRRGGWLISQLEKRYGRRLSLYPHKKWQTTSCPGNIDINRLRAEADNPQGEDMVTDQDLDVVRIAHSEIGGWPFNETHAGKFDREFMGSWKGKPMAALIRAQFFAPQRFSAHREAVFAAAAELSKRPTQENFDALKEQLRKAEDSAAVANLKVAQLEQEKQADQEFGDSFSRRLGQWIKKIIPGM